MKRKAIAMAMAMMMIASAASVCSAASVTDFKDVPSQSWYYTSVKGAVDDGYMNGVSKDAFAPSNNLTRAMFATILARYDKATVDNTAASAFTDVEANKWYTGSVVWGNKNGIINGYSATKFGTNDFIKREDLALMVYRYVNFKKYTLKEKTPVTFKDADQISAYAKEALEYCRVHGLFIGDQNGYLHPQKLITRAEAAAVMERIDLVIKENTGGGSSGGGGGSTSESKDYTVNVKISKDEIGPFDFPSYDHDKDSKYHVTYRNNAVSSSDALDLLHVAQGLVNEANIEDAFKEAKLVNKENNKFVGISYNGQEVISADGTINTVVVKKVKLSEVVSVDEFADEVVAAIQDETFNAQDVKNVINILDDSSNESKELTDTQKKVVSAIAKKIENDGTDKIVAKVKEKYPDLANTAEKAGIDIKSVVEKYRDGLEALAGTKARSVDTYSADDSDSVFGGMAVEVNPYTVAKENYPSDIDAFIDAYFPNNKYISKETLKASQSQGVEDLWEALNPELWAPNGKLKVANNVVNYKEYQELSESVVKALDHIRINIFAGKDAETIKPQLKELLGNLESRVSGVTYSISRDTLVDELVDELAPVVVKETPTLEDIPSSLLNQDITITVNISENDIINNLNTALSRKDKSYTSGDSDLADKVISKAAGTYNLILNISKNKCEEK